MTHLARFLLGVGAFLFLIAFPLVVYLKRRGVTNQQMFLYFFLNYLLWYLPYAPIHEGAHLVAGWLAGLHARSIRLMPHFWRGDFVNGYIDWAGGSRWQIFLSCQAPYALDALAVLLGFVLLRRSRDYAPLLGAFILTQTYLRSVFDVAVNYSAGTLAASGDFHFMLSGFSSLAVHAAAWAVMLAGAWGALHEILKARPATVAAAASAGLVSSI